MDAQLEVAGNAAMIVLALIGCVLAIMQAVVMHRGRDKGDGGLTEGQREALHGTATNVRELRRVVEAHATILAAIAETQKMQGARFNEYLRALQQGYPQYVCRVGDVQTALAALQDRVSHLEYDER